jgi:hypothetical protein
VLSLSLTTLGAVALAHRDASAAASAYREALSLGVGLGSAWACANALVGFAALAVTQGDHTAAAQLLGAIETLREESQQHRLANYAHHNETTQAVRAALNESVFAMAWEAGRAVAAEEAVTLPEDLGLLANLACVADTRT